jgi:hypothetical protein
MVRQTNLDRVVGQELVVVSVLLALLDMVLVVVVVVAQMEIQVTWLVHQELRGL